MTKITYIIGDATRPIGEGKKIIPHICNDLGVFGGGFSGAVGRRWQAVEANYRNLKKRTLGEVQFIQVTENICVANMIAQHGVGKTKDGQPPIRYDALRECLFAVNFAANNVNATLHCPRFGAGLAGGDWKIIEQIIKDVVTVDVYIYELKLI